LSDEPRRRAPAQRWGCNTIDAMQDKRAILRGPEILAGFGCSKILLACPHDYLRPLLATSCAAAGFLLLTARLDQAGIKRDP
jgi:hypothetical protein